MKTTHRQCFLRGPTGNVYIAYLPNDIAKVGTYYQADGKPSFHIVEVYLIDE